MDKTEEQKKEESLKEGIDFLLEQGWGKENVEVNVETPKNDQETLAFKNQQLTF